MLTRLRIRNFKRFQDVDIELGDVVVFIGPNNAGKTSALQALSLWELGVRRWAEKRLGGAKTKSASATTGAKSRTGVAINRRDLLALPIPETNLLWRDLHVREGEEKDGQRKTLNIRISIDVEGVTDGTAWSCGIEFDYANAESIYCRALDPTAAPGAKEPSEAVPDAARSVRVAFLPPMSGLAAREDRLERGSIQVRLGEGRTADVLRNLCHQLAEQAPAEWDLLVARMKALFGVTIEPPDYIAERGELVMNYREERGIRLDLSAAGRGLQQTLLLLAYILGNPGSVLLLDEPDAHLEILRQRQIYAAISELARAKSCQVVAASHSEVILREAAEQDVLVAFVGKPHRLDDRGSQVAKALNLIGFEQYYLAESVGWVLYLEGSTDLAILQAFARILEHPVSAALEKPFVREIGNQPQQARDHFYGLAEAKPDLVGLILTDRLDKATESADRLPASQWRRRELENYLCQPEVLVAYARQLAAEAGSGLPLLESAQARRFVDTMQTCIADRVPPVALRERNDPWWSTVKATDEFLDPLFEAFFRKLDLPNLMRKSDYHRLATLVPKESIDPEIAEKLNAILATASRARPVRDAENGA